MTSFKSMYQPSQTPPFHSHEGRYNGLQSMPLPNVGYQPWQFQPVFYNVQQPYQPNYFQDQSRPSFSNASHQLMYNWSYLEESRQRNAIYLSPVCYSSSVPSIEPVTCSHPLLVSSMQNNAFCETQNPILQSASSHFINPARTSDPSGCCNGDYPWMYNNEMQNRYWFSSPSGRLTKSVLKSRGQPNQQEQIWENFSQLHISESNIGVENKEENAVVPNCTEGPTTINKASEMATTNGTILQNKNLRCQQNDPDALATKTNGSNSTLVKSINCKSSESNQGINNLKKTRPVVETGEPHDNPDCTAAERQSSEETTPMQNKSLVQNVVKKGKLRSDITTRNKKSEEGNSRKSDSGPSVKRRKRRRKRKQVMVSPRFNTCQDVKSIKSDKTANADKSKCKVSEKTEGAATNIEDSTIRSRVFFRRRR